MEPRLILKVSAKVFGWVPLVQLICCAPKQVALANVSRQSSRDGVLREDLKSEGLKLPASSLWIPCITVFLVILGVVIALT